MPNLRFLVCTLILAAAISGLTLWVTGQTPVAANDTILKPASIAAVDFGRLVSENEEHRRARTELVQTLMAEMRVEQDRLDQKQADIEQKMSQVTQGGIEFRRLMQEKLSLGEQFIEKQAEFTDREISESQALNIALDQLIQASITAVCQRRGIDAVLNLKYTKMASPDRVDFQVKAFEDVVVWRSDNVPDITDEVLAEMKSRQKPTESSGDAPTEGETPPGGASQPAEGAGE